MEILEIDKSAEEIAENAIKEIKKKPWIQQIRAFFFTL